VFAVFFFTSLVFVLYDYIVQKRQAKVMASAIRTNNIVSSLFPLSVRDRLYRNKAQEDKITGREHEESTHTPVGGSYSKKQMQSFLSNTKVASVFVPTRHCDVH
jgi:hypothetical protein